MDCSDSKDVTGSTLQFLLFAKMVGCLAAIIFTVVAVCVECHKWVFNLNAKVVFYFHLFLMVVAPIAQFVPLLLEYLRRVITDANGCHYLVSSLQSFIITIPSSIIGYLQTASIVAFFIDRAIATIWSKYYDRMTSCYLGVMLNLITGLVLTIVFSVIIAWPLSFSGSGTFGTFHKEKTIFMLAICIAVELPTVVGYCILKRYNAARVRKISQTPGKTLSFRYQVRENLNVISQVIPLFSCHLVILLICATFHIFLYFFLSASKTASYFVAASDENLFYPLCISFYIIVCHNLHLRVGGSVAFFQSQAERHFSHLNDIWTKTQEEERY